MNGFYTKSGTIYYIDSVNKLVWGGKIISPVLFVTLRAIIGTRGRIQLINGVIVDTNIVEGYF